MEDVGLVCLTFLSPQACPKKGLKNRILNIMQQLEINKKPAPWYIVLLKTIQFILTLRKIQKTSCQETKDAPHEDANHQEKSEKSQFQEEASDSKNN